MRNGLSSAAGGAPPGMGPVDRPGPVPEGRMKLGDLGEPLPGAKGNWGTTEEESAEGGMLEAYLFTKRGGRTNVKAPIRWKIVDE